MEFRDLKKQYVALKPQIDAGIAQVLSGARFISGPQVIIEHERYKYIAAIWWDLCSVRHCMSCAFHTKYLALLMVLQARDFKTLQMKKLKFNDVKWYDMTQVTQ